MRAKISSLLPVLVLLGCGELHNELLTHGTIVGKVVNADRSVAYAAVLDDDAYDRSGIENDGSFKLQDIPAGDHQVYVVVSATEAVSVTATVLGGQITDLGVISGAPAASLTLTLVTPGGQRVGNGVVWLEGYPAPSLDVDDFGVATYSPLPAGCYEAKGYLEGLGEADQELCLAPGESKTVSLYLSDPDGTSGHEGCSKTGCEDGLSCQSDGSCR